MPRKTEGCWTCRARKKRCDSQRPACAACTSRFITCYGYDGKPEWMNNGDIEREVMELLHQKIKKSYSLRRARASRPYANLDKSLLVLDAGPPVTFQLSPNSDGQHLSLPQLDNVQSPTGNHCSNFTVVHSAETSLLQPFSQSTPEMTLSLASRDELNVRCSYDERDLDLLMYYLDHIHPRQFPFYRSRPSDIGRGWLLNLHLRTKPLFTATTTLSACDQAQFALGPLSNFPQPYEELEQQHVMSLIDLQDHLAVLSRKTGASHIAATVEALACVIQLICFELWIPRKRLDGDWVMHLDAAGSLLCTLDTISDPEGSVLPWWEQHGDVGERPELQSLSTGEKEAYRIFLTTYTWYFIISSAIVGLTPTARQSIPRTQALFHAQQTRLREIMGCEDLVMTAILDIAILDDWKKKNKSNGTLSFRDLARRADVIEARLNNALTAFTASKSLSELGMDRVKCMVTEIFIHGAFTFLHVVVSGFYPDLPEIYRSVMRTLEAMEAMQESSHMRYVTWPFGMAASMAIESEQQRFRDLVPKHKHGEHPLVVISWALDIVETCWAIRRTQSKGDEACDLVSAMNHMGTRLLLL